MSSNANTKILLTPIQQFFAGSTILITGATGFMGKCLMEKLLRSCSDLEKIYIVVREKKGKQSEERVEEIFQDVIFDRVRAININKVVVLNGDVSLPGLGLNSYDRALLQKEVDIVFHMAATVTFNTKLRAAMSVNVNSTKEIIDLCKQMTSLKSLVYVSTAFSNCNRWVINEQFYEFPKTYEDITTLLDTNDEEKIEALTPEIIGSWPNTYTFTKAFAENLVKDVRSILPVSVFRPSIVVSTWKEPIQGWIDNVYGPTGICAAAMKGLLTTMNFDKKLVANLVPVDYATNALIACAWDTGVRNKKENIYRGVTQHGLERKEGNEIGSVYQGTNIRNIKTEPRMETDSAIFNYVSSVEKYITWGEFCAINVVLIKENPLKNTIWFLNFDITNNFYLYTFYMFFLHYLPALLSDFCIFLVGKKRRFVKIYKKMELLFKTSKCFLNKDWVFHDNNIQQLWLLLDSRDKEIFQFNMFEINWLDYFHTYIPGLRKYLFKEDEDTLPDAFRKQKMFMIAYVCIKYTFIYLIMYVIFYFITNMLMF